MPELCLFTIPKAFTGHVGLIQRNAIRSWMRLGSSVEIVLCGDDAGVEATARSFGIDWSGPLARNEHGTPLLSDAFVKILQRTEAPLLAFSNADILLPLNFVKVCGAVARSRRDFLLAGECRELRVERELDCEEGMERAFLRARGEGISRGDAAIDYFVFPPRLVEGFPEMAVGRGAWDNYFLYRARSLGFDLIDASESVNAVHQSHDYRHHSGGKQGAYRGNEYELHAQILGSKEREFRLVNATHLVRDGKLQPACDTRHWKRFYRTEAVLRPEKRRRYRAAWKTIKILARIAPSVERMLESRWRRRRQIQ